MNFGDPENKKKYNGIEKIGDLGLEDYDAQFRELDPQIGRWWEIDPKVDNMEMWSPYTSNYDNPITYKDPLGDEGEGTNGCCKGIIEDILIFGASAANAFATNQVGGIGRADPTVFGDDHSAAISQSGLILGDMLTILGAIVTDFGGTVAAIGSAGTLALPAAGLMVQQTTIAAPTAFRNLMNDFSAQNDKSSSNNSSSQSQVKQSKVEKSTKIENIGSNNVGGGIFTKKTEVRPGTGPGQSRAEYIRYKNSNGKTIRSVKDSYDRANKFQGRKPTEGDPEGKRSKRKTNDKN